MEITIFDKTPGEDIENESGGWAAISFFKDKKNDFDLEVIAKISKGIIIEAPDEISEDLMLELEDNGFDYESP